jgi:hypothetical protein
MGLDHIKAEIARMRVQIKRQQKDIISLQKAGISTTSAVALFGADAGQGRRALP